MDPGTGTKSRGRRPKYNPPIRDSFCRRTLVGYSNNVVLPRWRPLRLLLLLRLGYVGSRTTSLSSSTTVLLLSSSSTITASSHEQESSTHSARRTDVQRFEYASREFRFIGTSCRIPAASSERGSIPSCSTRFLWPSCRSICDLFGYMVLVRATIELGANTDPDQRHTDHGTTTLHPLACYSNSIRSLEVHEEGDETHQATIQTSSGRFRYYHP